MATVGLRGGDAGVEDDGSSQTPKIFGCPGKEVLVKG